VGHWWYGCANRRKLPTLINGVVKMPNIDADDEITLVLLIIFVMITIAVSITRIFLSPKTRPFMLQYEGIVAPFFGLPAVLFSLSTALMGTSIWENYNIASQAIKTESQGLIQIISLASTIPELKDNNLANATRIYAKSILNEEWQTLTSDRKDAPKTIEKFIAMRSDLFKAANQLNNNAESKVLMNAFQTVNNARSIRLAYASFDVHPLRISGILLLALLVLVTVAFIHAAKPKSLVVAMFIATSTVLIPICLVALTFSSPYIGVISISNKAYLLIQ
jgi:hypothetical protein